MPLYKPRSGYLWVSLIWAAWTRWWRGWAWWFMCDLWLLCTDAHSYFRQKKSLNGVCLVSSEAKGTVLATFFSLFPLTFWVLSQRILPPTAFKGVPTQMRSLIWKQNSGSEGRLEKNRETSSAIGLFITVLHYNCRMSSVQEKKWVECHNTDVCSFSCNEKGTE